MSHRLQRAALWTSAVLFVTIGYLSTTQASFAELDCTKTPKTNFEDATCQSRWKAGVLKSPPPRMVRQQSVKPFKQVRYPKPRTWEEHERLARAFCDEAGGPLACGGYYGWLANNPRPADIKAPYTPRLSAFPR